MQNFLVKQLLMDNILISGIFGACILGGHTEYIIYSGVCFLSLPFWKLCHKWTWTARENNGYTF